MHNCQNNLWVFQPLDDIQINITLKIVTELKWVGVVGTSCVMFNKKNSFHIQMNAPRNGNYFERKS